MANFMAHEIPNLEEANRPEDCGTVIGPEFLVPMTATYAAEAKRVLEISEEEATRQSERKDGGRFALDAVIRSLKDTKAHANAFYYAKFRLDEEGEIGSIHHGWSFDTFANVNGEELKPLPTLQFANTMDGILSAFFVSVILPTIGAFWHGLYERDYQLIVSSNELNEVTRITDTGDVRSIIKIPLGLRIKKIDGNTSCKCLFHSETEGLLDVELTISEDGRASEPVLTVLCEPQGRTFY